MSSVFLYNILLILFNKICRYISNIFIIVVTYNLVFKNIYIDTICMKHGKKVRGNKSYRNFFKPMF